VLIALLALSVSTQAAINVKKEGDRKRAPDFELKDAAGRVVRLSDYQGRVVLLDFWATWCGPCRQSMPWFNEVSEKYSASGLTVLGVSIDKDGWDVVKPFIEKMGIKYPIVVSSARVLYLYGDVESVPLAFLIDRNQRVAAIHPGEASRKDFERALKTLLDAPASDVKSASAGK